MSRTHSAVNDALLQRVYSEFLEMPGLRLTRQQAQRLWGLDEETCDQVLACLIDAKFLCRPDHGMYARTAGYAPPPRPRMVKASMDDAVLRRRKAV